MQNFDVLPIVRLKKSENVNLIYSCKCITKYQLIIGDEQEEKIDHYLLYCKIHKKIISDINYEIRNKDG